MFVLWAGSGGQPSVLIRLEAVQCPSRLEQACVGGGWSVPASHN